MTSVVARKPRLSPRAAEGVAGASRTGGAVRGGDRDTEEHVYRAVARTLMEGKLRPGTPLRERYLSEVFGVTRGAVRKVLARLGHEGKLEILRNRGAYVPQPSSDDMRGVYDARKAVEAGIAALLASRITDAQLGHLRAHVRAERRAMRQGRRDESIRLAGAFHGEMVALLDNPELQAIVQRLVGRTQMFVALFESARDSGCAPDEHSAVIEALAARDPAGAAAAMLDHLSHVQERVTREVSSPLARDLADILRASLDESQAAGDA